MWCRHLWVVGWVRRRFGIGPGLVSILPHCVREEVVRDVYYFCWFLWRVFRV